jgi:hypothetical protein
LDSVGDIVMEVKLNEQPSIYLRITKPFGTCSNSQFFIRRTAPLSLCVCVLPQLPTLLLLFLYCQSTIRPV